jgi:hypothetical protein
MSPRNLSGDITVPWSAITAAPHTNLKISGNNPREITIPLFKRIARLRLRLRLKEWGQVFSGCPRTIFKENKMKLFFTVNFLNLPRKKYPCPAMVNL